MSLIPIKKTDVIVGYPLPYSIYDAQRKLLLREGVVVQSVSQLEGLSERGLFREPPRRLRDRTDGINKEQDNKPPEKQFDLEDIRLSIGDTLQMQANGDETQRYYVKLVGFSKGKSVLVTTPSADGNTILMKEGQSFVVRLFSGKNVYAFPTAINKVAHSPFPYLHLNYPLSVRGLALRRSTRVDVSIIASITHGSGKSHAATICNLSKQGALLVSKSAMGLKDEKLSIKFRIKVDDVEQYVTVSGAIRMLQPAPDLEGAMPGVHHGVEFTEIPEQDRLALTAFVYQMQLEQSAEG